MRATADSLNLAWHNLKYPPKTDEFNFKLTSFLTITHTRIFHIFTPQTKKKCCVYYCIYTFSFCCKNESVKNWRPDPLTFVQSHTGFWPVIEHDLHEYLSEQRVPVHPTQQQEHFKWSHLESSPAVGTLEEALTWNCPIPVDKDQETAIDQAIHEASKSVVWTRWTRERKFKGTCELQRYGFYRVTVVQVDQILWPLDIGTYLPGPNVELRAYFIDLQVATLPIQMCIRPIPIP